MTESTLSSSTPPAATSVRAQTEEAFLDAAERLLVDVGYAGISTRRLADAAHANHGLVHYYFGSMENLFVRVLERFTERLVKRQREMYARDVPFIEKWRAAWRYHEDDLEAGYPKIWFELQAMAWNEPRMRERLFAVNDEWREVLTEAFEQPRREYGIDMPLDALVSLVMTFNVGIMVERLGGIGTGHQKLLEWIDGWLSKSSS